MKRQSALVVFSGGQDSTTCLFWAKQHYERVEAVTFAYGQRHHLEIQVAKEIAEEQGIHHHVLFIDSYHTWWKQGKSYLCRLVDALNIGLVDEVIIGKEVLQRWPELLSEIIQDTPN